MNFFVVVILYVCLSFQFHDTLASDQENDNFLLEIFAPEEPLQHNDPIATHLWPAPQYTTYIQEPPQQNNPEPADTWHMSNPQNHIDPQQSAPLQYAQPFTDAMLTIDNSTAILMQLFELNQAQPLQPAPQSSGHSVHTPEPGLESSSTTASSSIGKSRKRSFHRITPPITLDKDSDDPALIESLNTEWQRLARYTSYSCKHTHPNPQKALAKTFEFLERLKKTNLDPEHFHYRHTYIKITQLYLKFCQQNPNNISNPTYLSEARKWFNQINQSNLNRGDVTEYRKLQKQLNEFSA